MQEKMWYGLAARTLITQLRYKQQSIMISVIMGVFRAPETW